MSTEVKKQETEQKKGMSTGLIIVIILLILFFIIAGISTSNPVGGFIWMGYGFQSLFGLIGSLFTQKIRY
jgi:hypothetical protein